VREIVHEGNIDNTEPFVEFQVMEQRSILLAEDRQLIKATVASLGYPAATRLEACVRGDCALMRWIISTHIVPTHFGFLKMLQSNMSNMKRWIFHDVLT
jgi:hypothetical protein